MRRFSRRSREDPGAARSKAPRADEVVFEVPSLSQARDLIRRLEDRWECRSRERANLASVSVLLPDARGHELAGLLRTVEAWVAERAHGGIMFRLDGRDYLLRAPDARRPANELSQPAPNGAG